MPNPLADDARALSNEELGEAINEAYREMFNLQFQRGTRQLQNPMAIRTARRQIARLRTIYRQRQQSAALGQTIAPLARPTAPAVLPPDDEDAADMPDAPEEDVAEDAAPEPEDDLAQDAPTAEAPTAETDDAGPAQSTDEPTDEPTDDAQPAQTNPTSKDD